MDLGLVISPRQNKHWLLGAGTNRYLRPHFDDVDDRCSMGNIDRDLPNKSQIWQGTTR